MFNNNNVHIVIMAGGIGSRFWPMSTPEYPKQFIDVLGIGKSLLQLTVERFKGVCPDENFWVVTSEKYVDIVKEQLPQMPAQHILAEPEARNTAPCISWACWKIKEECPQADIVVTPSDAVVIDTDEFRRCIKEAIAFTHEGHRIVTLGMKPTRPETGYGYIEAAEETATQGIYKVAAFKEKPNLEKAQEYIAQGNYFWNAGIFVWNAESLVSEILKHAPQIAGMMDKMAATFGTDKEQEATKALFPQCEKISIDYAVMEKSDSIYTLPAEFGWSDLGSWGSLKTRLPQDENSNAGVGEGIRFIDSRHCIVHTPNKKKVVVEGLDGYIVVDKDDKLLICRLENEQHIKDYAN